MYQNEADNKKRNKESLNKGSKWEDTGGKKEALKETTEPENCTCKKIKNIKNLYETRQAHAERVTQL